MKYSESVRQIHTESNEEWKICIDATDGPELQGVGADTSDCNENVFISCNPVIDCIRWRFHSRAFIIKSNLFLLWGFSCRRIEEKGNI